MATAAAAAERRLDPAAGVMVQAVWFDAGASDPGRLLLTIHHLAVDGVSWRILVPDLAAAWQAISSGQAVALAARGTSFRRWAEQLAAHARDGGVVDELSFWSGELGKPSLPLARDGLDPVRDTLGTAGHLTLTLPAGVTQPLLTQVPSAFHGGINDVLLTGLAVAVADWCRRHVQGAAASAGSHAVLLDLEGHGREEGYCREERLGRDGSRLGVRQDVSARRHWILTRTVGWFTSLYPVRLDPGLLDLEEALGGGAALGRALKTIKEQLRAMPGKGLGYGLLRYLNPQTATGQLSGAARAAAWLQLSGAVCRRRGTPDWGAGGEALINECARLGWAAAMRRCRWRMSSRSTR